MDALVGRLVSETLPHRERLLTVLIEARRHFGLGDDRYAHALNAAILPRQDRAGQSAARLLLQLPVAVVRRAGAPLRERLATWIVEEDGDPLEVLALRAWLGDADAGARLIVAFEAKAPRSAYTMNLLAQYLGGVEGEAAAVAIARQLRSPLYVCDNIKPVSVRHALVAALRKHYPKESLLHRDPDALDTRIAIERWASDELGIQYDKPRASWPPRRPNCHPI